MIKEYLIRLKLNPHTRPLLIILVAVAIGQTVALIQNPLVSTTVDSTTYIQMAHDILAAPRGLVNPFRTPGYPLFLATLFQLVGVDHLGKVVGAQAFLAILAVFECYLLAFRLTHRQWLACLAASAIGINLYIVSWERTIMTEALSWWSLITLFLCYERFIHHPRLRWGGLLPSWES